MSQSGIWPILCKLMTILAKFLDINFKCVLPSFTFILIYKPILKSIRPKLYFISPKILFLVNETCSIGQNGVLRYGHFSDFLEYFWGYNFWSDEF